jgi:hypothetical protein
VIGILVSGVRSIVFWVLGTLWDGTVDDLHCFILIKRRFRLFLIFEEHECMNGFLDPAVENLKEPTEVWDNCLKCYSIATFPSRST